MESEGELMAKYRRTSLNNFEMKKKLIRIYGERCRWCSSNIQIELDHIVPLWNGGTNREDNLQLLCQSCHKTKTRKEALERNVLNPVYMVRDGVPMLCKGK